MQNWFIHICYFYDMQWANTLKIQVFIWERWFYAAHAQNDSRAQSINYLRQQKIAHLSKFFERLASCEIGSLEII